jgi:hypothetical protein
MPHLAFPLLPLLSRLRISKHFATLRETRFPAFPITISDMSTSSENDWCEAPQTGWPGWPIPHSCKFCNEFFLDYRTFHENNDRMLEKEGYPIRTSYDQSFYRSTGRGDERLFKSKFWGRACHAGCDFARTVFRGSKEETMKGEDVEAIITTDGSLVTFSKYSRDQEEIHFEVDTLTGKPLFSYIECRNQLDEKL